MSGRDERGRFRPGFGGRPKGSRNRRKLYTPNEFETRVVAEAERRLDAMMAKATEVLERKVEKGDLRAAIWVLENAPGAKSKRISTAVPLERLDSLPAIVEAAETVAGMSGTGELCLEEAARYIRKLEGTANLRGFLEMSDLRSEIDGLKRDGAAAASRSLDHLPVWARKRQQLGIRKKVEREHHGEDGETNPRTS